MAVEPDRPRAGQSSPIEHFDVPILGAGLSGIGAACHLRRSCPGKSLAILEARDALGGTWDLFRYPGIRSDSDMFTMGYSFRPWEDARGIADGPSILRYINDTARAQGVDRLIRFGHRAINASWSSTDARWTVIAERAESGEHTVFTCGFLYSCTGYYRYDKGYEPSFAGSGDFRELLRSNEPDEQRGFRGVVWVPAEGAKLVMRRRLRERSRVGDLVVA